MNARVLPPVNPPAGVFASAGSTCLATVKLPVFCAIVFDTVITAVWPSTMVFGPSVDGLSHWNDPFFRLPLGWVSVTEQLTPAGMFEMVCGVAVVTEKLPVMAPQVQLPVNGVAELPLNPLSGSAMLFWMRSAPVR